MSHSAFYGRIYTGDVEVATRVLEKWITPYLLEGQTSASLDEIKEALQRLLEICREIDVTATFEYVEVSEDGEELSEEFSIR